ncbi:MAG: hypothetical protein AAFU70_10855, partial [Planctomycetota bacterium]
MDDAPPRRERDEDDQNTHNNEEPPHNDDNGYDGDHHEAGDDAARRGPSDGSAATFVVETRTVDDLSRLQRLDNVAADVGLASGHLRSKRCAPPAPPAPPEEAPIAVTAAAASFDAAPATTSAAGAAASPISITAIQELADGGDAVVVLVDGYRRVAAHRAGRVPPATEVHVRKYTVPTVVDALVLRAQLNLDASRSLAKFDALVLLVALFDGDVRAIARRTGGRGRRRPPRVDRERPSSSSSSSRPNKFLAQKWNQLRWEPKLTAKDLEAGRPIMARMRDDARLARLVDEHLRGVKKDDGDGDADDEGD